MALFKKTEKYTYENKRKENQAQRLVYKKKSEPQQALKPVIYLFFLLF